MKQLDKDLIQSARHQKADAAFQEYEFGDYEVESAQGWVYVQPGLEMTRKVVLRDAGDGCVFEVNFTTTFESESSPDVVGAYALIASNGSPIGREARSGENSVDRRCKP